MAATAWGAAARGLLAWACIAASSTAQALPSAAEVQAQFQPSEAYVLSREGELLHRQRTNLQVRRGQWVSLADISPALRMALIVSEDKRFYEHSGVDWLAVPAAAWGQLWHSKTRGASTITMQLAGLLDEDLQARSSGRSVAQKLGQVVSATWLERSWRKDQILETYLNLVPFRGELVGVDALSRTLFGKASQGLDATESAIAVALLRGPNAQPSIVAARACTVLQALPASMAVAVDCAVVRWRTDQALQARRWPASEGVALHWSARVLRHAPAQQRLITTVSAPLQRLAQASLQRHLLELQGRNVEDGAVVVLDNRSGQVLAWVGSSGGLSQAAHVDGVLARRQPGSTLKPFLYAQALEQSRLTAASLIEDSAAHIATPSGLYIPQNYDRSFKGWVSVRTALAASLNVPAVRALNMVTPDDFFELMQRLGLGLKANAGFYGYSLALGSAEVTLLDLTNAYRALANQGQWTPVAAAMLDVSTAPQPMSVLSPTASFIVGDILADAQARSMTFGVDSVLSTRFWTAVKTGTSKDMRDNWAVGWSQHYTVGVWVGNASGQAMHGVSGSSGAAPIWADVMAGLHAAQSSQAPHPPDGVRQTRISFVMPASSTVLERSRNEWFVAGTERSEWTMAAAQHAPKIGRIVLPVNGTVIALDPDIPPQHQMLQLKADRDDVRWQVGRRELGPGAKVQWSPLPGRHRLQLLDTQGRVLDRIQIEVRGAASTVH